MRYNLFDPTPCGFPVPRLPVLPRLGWESLSCRSSIRPFLLPHGKACRSYTRGRYALHDAYSFSGLNEAGSLLLPAYHCRSIIDPAVRLGAEVLFYPLDRNMKPNLDVIRDLFCKIKNIKCIVVTHYFGFAQDVEELASLCDQFNVALIEDCAHVFNYSGEIVKPGGRGRFSTFSPYKFFPCDDGGLLIMPDDAVDTERQSISPSLVQEVKGVLGSVRQLFGKDYTGMLNVDSLDKEINAINSDHSIGALDVQQDISIPSVAYWPAKEGLEELRWSRWLINKTNIDRLAEQRRKNYLVWLRELKDVPNCYPIFSELPDDCVPYVFPLYVKHPAAHFHILKHLGIPILRWDEMAVSECEVSLDYRFKLLQFPCHQELTSEQMAWMTTAVRQVMRSVVK